MRRIFFIALLTTLLPVFSHAYYQSKQGRWISRDSLEEDGGVNLFGFVENNAIGYIDYLGGEICCPDGADPVKDPSCVADCKQTYLIDCYNAARVAAAASGGFVAGGAFQGWNKSGSKPGGGVAGGGRSGSYGSRTRGWARSRGYGATGRYSTGTGRFARHVGRKSVGSMAAAWSGVTLLALHTECLAGYPVACRDVRRSARD